MQRYSQLALAFVLASACSDSSEDAASSGSEFGCREPMDETFCTQFLVFDETDLDAAKESCALGDVREVIGGCPTADVAGCCVLDTAQYTAHQCYYPPSTTEDVQEQCMMLGQDFVSAP